MPFLADLHPMDRAPDSAADRALDAAHRALRNPSPGREFQPYYVAYAIAHGMTPQQMLDVEREAGHCAGFMSWVQRRWRAWEKANNRPERCPKSPADHASFAQFLVLAGDEE